MTRSDPATPAASPKEPLTRAAIVAAARRLIRSEGFDNTSLRRLARELGVTAPALYAHVHDKADLLAALAETGFQELLDRFDHVDGGPSDDPLGRVRAHTLAYVDQAVQDPELFRVMFLFRPGSLDVPGVDNVLPAATLAFERAADAVGEALEAGAIHATHDPVTAALTVWITAHGIANVLLLGIPADGEAGAALAATVVDVCLSGLAAPARTSG